ncbi:DUF2914 domain-containing protein [Methylobacter marinus]|uniref:DUF2914 domain-containing protein n=1 Tax=Methylobacter marinus TaxID=34058 RepID=UPI000375D94D|nr:DUF2914 domain-containing protein [Methylobacter marinus]
MRDKKNIVIRVNYSKSGRKAGSVGAAPEMVTEWHVKRIVLAVIVIGMLIFSALYFLLNPGEQNAEVSLSDTDFNASVKPEEKDVYIQERPKPIKPENKSVAINNIIEAETQKQKPSIKVEVKKKQRTIISQENVTRKMSASVINKNVSRALLTDKINNKEPAGELNLPVAVNKAQAVGVYYFTELTGLKGRTLYHEWLNNGEVVFNRRLNILGNRWRTSSSKLFTDNDVGNWSVRLIDENERILNKKSFKVVTIK